MNFIRITIATCLCFHLLIINSQRELNEDFMYNKNCYYAKSKFRSLLATGEVVLSIFIRVILFSMHKHYPIIMKSETERKRESSLSAMLL